MHGLRQLPLPGPPFRLLDPALRLILAGVLLYASWDKLLHPEAFARQVQAYHILPDMLVNLTAIWLPWLELCLGLSLASGLWSEGAACLTSALFAAFWLALIANYFRGIDVDCGCFSTTTATIPAQPGSGPEAAPEPAPMLWYLGRDALLLALALTTARVRLLRLRAQAQPPAEAPGT